MKKFITELKEFAIKGNVVDLAVGLIIGSAFTKVVSSLVSDVVMPPIGLLVGGINFTDIVWTLSPLVTINIGVFLQACIDLVIISTAVFFVIKLINRLRRDKEKENPSPAPTSEEILILREIRDLLKK